MQDLRDLKQTLGKELPGRTELRIDADTLGLRDLDIFGWKPFKKKVPPKASERLASLILRQARDVNAFLVHAGAYASASVLLLCTNAATTMFAADAPLPARAWSLLAIGGWGMGVVFHALDTFVTKPPQWADERRTLEEEMGRELEAAVPPDTDDLEALRQRLLQRSEEARAALRPMAGDAAATVTRGEMQALSVVAWLDAARRQSARGGVSAEERRALARQLSDPHQHERHAALRATLERVDRREQMLAALEREASDRRARLESFLLALDSARMARPESLPAVTAPLLERVSLLCEVGTRPQLPAPASTESPEGRSARMEQEVLMAQELQRTILPERAPYVRGLDVAHIYRPCNEVGGDFYDFHVVASSRLWLAIGDASGHGIDSSMVSSMCKSGLYLQASAGRSLQDAMGEINRMMCDTLGRRRIMTLALVEIDADSGRLSFANAGQVFPLLVRRGVLTELDAPSYPLGVRRDTQFPVIEHRLEPGDALLMTTDGVVEAHDAHGRAYGWDGLFACLKGHSVDGAGSLVEAVAADLTHHLGAVAPQDDVTLVGLVWRP